MLDYIAHLNRIWPTWENDMRSAIMKATIVNDITISQAFIEAYTKKRVNADARDIEYMTSAGSQLMYMAYLWQQTRHIYKLSPDVIKQLKRRPFPDELPTKLPAKCIYVQTPGLKLSKYANVDGIAVMIDRDTKRADMPVITDLQFAIFDKGRKPCSLAIPIAKTKDEIKILMRRRDQQISKTRGWAMPTMSGDAVLEAARPLVTIVDRVCKEAPPSIRVSASMPPTVTAITE